MNNNRITVPRCNNQETTGQLSLLRGRSNMAGPLNLNNVVRITKSTLYEEDQNQ